MQQLEGRAFFRGSPLGVGRVTGSTGVSKRSPAYVFCARRGHDRLASNSKPATRQAAPGKGLFGLTFKGVEPGHILKFPSWNKKTEESKTALTSQNTNSHTGSNVLMRWGRQTDTNTVFVAGATGRLGARIVRELLGQGYKVRAGVRSPKKAESFAEVCSTYGLLTSEELSRMVTVPFDLEKPQTFAKAVGNAGRVVCAAGAAGSLARVVDGKGTIALIEAAKASGVQQFVLVSNLGTGKIGFPAALTNIGGGVLNWKRKAEEALEASGIPYTIVRAGNMERAGDDFKRTHNLRLAPRDTLFGGQVSRSQVAELVSVCLDSKRESQNKVLEVVAESGVPAMLIEDMIAYIPASRIPEEAESPKQRGFNLVTQLTAAKEKLFAAESRIGDAKERMASLNAEAAELKQREEMVAREQRNASRSVQHTEAELSHLEQEADWSSQLASVAAAMLGASQRAQRESRMLSHKEIAEIRASALTVPQEHHVAAPASPSRSTHSWNGLLNSLSPGHHHVENSHSAGHGGFLGGILSHIPLQHGGHHHGGGSELPMKPTEDDFAALAAAAAEAAEIERRAKEDEEAKRDLALATARAERAREEKRRAAAAAVAQAQAAAEEAEELAAAAAAEKRREERLLREHGELSEWATRDGWKLTTAAMAAERVRIEKERAAAAAAAEADAAADVAQRQAMFMREALRQMKEAQAQEIAALYEQVEIEREEAEARYSQLEQEYLNEKARADQLEEELRAIQSGLTGKNNMVEELKRDLSQANDTVQALRQEVKMLMTKVAETEEALRQEQDAALQARADAVSLRTELESVQDALRHEQDFMEKVTQEAEAAMAASAQKQADLEAVLMEKELLEQALSAERNVVNAITKEKELVERALNAERELGDAVRFDGSAYENGRIRELENLATMLKQQLADASQDARKQKAAFDKAVAMREEMRHMKHDEVEKERERISMLEQELRSTQAELEDRNNLVQQLLEDSSGGLPTVQALRGEVSSMRDQVKMLMGKVAETDKALREEREHSNFARSEAVSLRTELAALQDALAKEQDMVERMRAEASNALEARYLGSSEEELSRSEFERMLSEVNSTLESERASMERLRQEASRTQAQLQEALDYSAALFERNEALNDMVSLERERNQELEVTASALGEQLMEASDLNREQQEAFDQKYSQAQDELAQEKDRINQLENELWSTREDLADLSGQVKELMNVLVAQSSPPSPSHEEFAASGHRF